VGEESDETGDDERSASTIDICSEGVEEGGFSLDPRVRGMVREAVAGPRRRREGPLGAADHQQLEELMQIEGKKAADAFDVGLLRARAEKEMVACVREFFRTREGSRARHLRISLDLRRNLWSGWQVRGGVEFPEQRAEFLEAFQKIARRAAPETPRRPSPATQTTSCDADPS
jgi:hypothetical protein